MHEREGAKAVRTSRLDERSPTAPRPLVSGYTRASRPDRAEKVAMTTRVRLSLRKCYEQLKAQLIGATMEELQAVALRAFLANFRGLPRSEWQAKWEALRRDYGNQATEDFGYD